MVVASSLFLKTPRLKSRMENTEKRLIVYGHKCYQLYTYTWSFIFFWTWIIVILPHPNKDNLKFLFFWPNFCLSVAYNMVSNNHNTYSTFKSFFLFIIFPLFLHKVLQFLIRMHEIVHLFVYFDEFKDETEEKSQIRLGKWGKRRNWSGSFTYFGCKTH